VHGKSTRQLHVGVRAVHGRVDGRCAAAYGPCNVSCTRPSTRPCNVSCARYTAAVYTAREHVFSRENGPYMAVRIHGPYTAVYGPCTRPVYTTCVYDCVQAVCTDVFGRVHCAYTASYTGRVHGHVRAVHTAVYTTRIRPRTLVYVSTCLRVQGPCTRPCTGHLHGRKRPSTRPYMAV